MEFKPFPKLARLTRKCIITEKLDGTNAQILIKPCSEFEGTEDTSDALGVFNDNVVFAGSRTRWIKPGKDRDNYGFASWVVANISELIKLGPGSHFGEWWGCSIQRTYNLHERRFSLFNASRWMPDAVARNVEEWGKVVHRVMDKDGNRCDCVGVVPILYRGLFSTAAADDALARLKAIGSYAAPGFMDPEGIVIYHVAGQHIFKKTYDDGPKGQ